MKITHATHFDAGHRMYPAPEEGYDRWHGHRYDIRVTLRTEGWENYPLDELRAGTAEALSTFDHRMLTWVGDAEGMAMFDDAVVLESQPTMETIARALMDRMVEVLGPRVCGLRISSQPDAWVEIER